MEERLRKVVARDCPHVKYWNVQEHGGREVTVTGSDGVGLKSAIRFYIPLGDTSESHIYAALWEIERNLREGKLGPGSTEGRPLFPSERAKIRKKSLMER